MKNVTPDSVPQSSASNPNFLRRQVVGAVAALALLGAGVKGAQFLFSSPHKSSGGEAKAEEHAGSYLNALHANGQEYKVTVPAGGSAYEILADNEPEAFNGGSQALNHALVEDIESQAANGSSMLQAGQTVEVPDVPDGTTEAPKNFIGPDTPNKPAP